MKKTSILKLSGCPSCGVPIKRSQLPKFMILFRYVCKNCGKVYSLPRAYSGILSVIGILFMSSIMAIFSLSYLQTIVIGGVTISFFATFFGPIVEFKNLKDKPVGKDRKGSDCE
jgi:hypothetical protein